MLALWLIDCVFSILDFWFAVGGLFIVLIRLVLGFCLVYGGLVLGFGFGFWLLILVLLRLLFVFYLCFDACCFVVLGDFGV